MTPIVDVFVVLLLGGALGWLSQRLGFPNAVAQVVLGVVLGTGVLGWVPHSDALHGLGEVGVVLLLGAAGLELGFGRLIAAGSTGASVAALGVIFSVGGGYAIGTLYGSPGEEALYLGLALGATSIGITVQLLEQFGLIGHRVADVLIAAAVIDDVIALYLLGAAHGLLTQGVETLDVLQVIVLAIAVLGGLFLACRLLTRWAVHRVLINSARRTGAWTLAAIGLGALLTDSLGLSLVVGAFFAGVGTGEALSSEVREQCVKTLRPLVMIMMPFFFVMIGVQAEWDILHQPALLRLVTSLIVVAVVAKAFGGVLGAWRIDRWRERWLIGFGMVARGEIALVIATLGFEQGHVTQSVFVSIVLMTIVLAVLGPLLMTPFAKLLESKP